MNNLKAVALCNNACAMIVWTWEGIIPDCLGFSLRRINKTTGERHVIESRLVKFKNQTDRIGTTTDEYPIQSNSWMDGQVREGSTYQWEVVPMIGTPGALTPGEAVLTNEVTPSVDFGPHIKACFNRGHLVSTQHMADKLPKLEDGSPDPSALVTAINDPTSDIYKWLSAGIGDFIRLPYEEAKHIGGHAYSLYYELSFPPFVEYLRQNQQAWSMVLGNTGKTDETNAATRKQLHEDGADVTDRFIPEGGIAHNKSVVLCNQAGEPVKWLLQSANPTPTGVCTQANQALYIDSPELARVGKDYYDRTKADCAANPIQSSEYRAANANVMEPVVLSDGTSVQAVFSPSTQFRDKPRAGDGVKSFDLLDMAASTKVVKDNLLRMRQGAGLVAFFPGTPSVVDVLDWLAYKNRKKSIFGTVSSPMALPRPPRKKKASAPEPTAPASEPIASASEPTASAPEPIASAPEPTAPASEPTASAPEPIASAPEPTASAPEPIASAPEPIASAPTASADGTSTATADPAVPAKPKRKGFPAIIAASALLNGYKEWHREMLKLPDAHAITHSKIAVVDPFGDDPTILGAASDNMGLKAAVCNDETLLVIKGNRPLAIAVYVFARDIYRHFLWRYRMSKGEIYEPELSDSPDWQQRFLGGKAYNEIKTIVERCSPSKAE